MPTAYELLDKLDQFSWDQNFHGHDLSGMIPLQPCLAQMNGPCTSKHLPENVIPFCGNRYAEVNPDDFGHAIKIGPEKLMPQQRLHFLNNYYTPPKPPLHEWPRLNPSFTERTDCNSMVYSPMYKGLFCRYCSLFPPSKAQSANAAFIKKPFIRFSHMFGNGGAVKKHINRKYHQEAEGRVKLFLQRIGAQLQPNHR
ncbi:unnamed protein product [Bursaphelenchus xylophilus]|uniref:(pine wood nematode) hypothetical protein n=1 Tax=Bursaphelenchus xylophilus TaxID=6326 RepID=A0A811KHB7_BURXY|nr:unnamed protein product [Bursaphelenchus xylophilus]CAG9097630.1 unnamed protein product [Bursaphelenchus xylophilus]